MTPPTPTPLNVIFAPVPVPPPETVGVALYPEPLCSNSTAVITPEFTVLTRRLQVLPSISSLFVLLIVSLSPTTYPVPPDTIVAVVILPVCNESTKNCAPDAPAPPPVIVTFALTT